MSAFDDLMNLGGDTSGNTNQSADIFGTNQSTDIFGTSQSTESSGGTLLDFGFDAQISTNNGPSGKVNLEANTNPLYEFNNTQDIMATESSNPMYEFNSEPQKEVKSDSSNPLYDFMQSENTNGHSEDAIITNGNSNEVDLLGGNNVDLLGGGDPVDSVDLLGGSGNTADLLQVESGDTGDTVDLLGGNSGPVTSDDSGVTVDTNMDLQGDIDISGEVTQDRSRSNSEGSEPEQENANVEQQADAEETREQNEAVGESDQNQGPIETDGNTVNEQGNIDNVDATVETNEEALEEGTNKAEAGEEKDNEPKPTEEAEVTNEAAEDSDAETNDNDEGEPPKQQLLTEDEEQFEDADPGARAEGVEVEEILETEQAPAEEVIEAKTEQQVESKAPEVATTGEDDVQSVDQVEVEKEQVSEQDEQQTGEPAAETDEVVTENVEGTDGQEVEEQAPEPNTEVEEEESFEQAAESDGKVEEVAVVEQAHEPVSIDDNNEPEPEENEPESVQEPEQQGEPDVSEEIVTETNVEAEESTPEDDVVETTPESNVEEMKPEEVSAELDAEESAVSAQEPEEGGNDDEVPAPETVQNVEPEEETPVSAMEPVESDVQEAVSAPDETVTEDLTDEADTVQVEDVKKTEQPAQAQTETRNSEQEENGVKVNGTSDVKENGVTEDEAVRDPNVIRETREKEEVHFAEMSNFRQKFESGKVSEDEPTQRKVSIHEEFGEGGEYESTPVQNPDVVRETDNIGEELPEVGSAKSLVDKFKTISEEKFEKSSKRASPPRESKVEYESQPSEHLEQYEGKSETGTFESNPSAPEDVVRSGDTVEDVKPESGTTKNIMNKFKDIQTENSAVKTHEKREITPDRSGKVEYVSEPRGERIEHKEAQSESGVFESTPKQEEGVVRALDKNEEVMPESGTTGSLLSKFKQMESETGNKPPPSPGRREITPDRSGKVEFVSEPRGFLEKYEQKEDSGVFESQPTVSTEVVRSGDSTEDVKPEAGSAMKAKEMFKEIQKQSSSPVHSNRKEITPPRETSPGRTIAGVVESTPQIRDDVVRNADTVQDELPAQGSAKNIANKFKEIQSGSPSNTPSRKQKEFTPPPESGVYESTPSEHLVVETRQSESGVIESTPSKSTADIARERDSVSPEAEQPESGMAKNLVSKFRQLESSAKNSTSPSPRFKEFTPPRDRGPISPKSPAGNTNGVQPSDLPGQYQQQDTPGIFENEPEVKADVYREGDRDETEELPKANTTMSMLQKFKSMQQQAVDDQNTPTPISRKEKGMFRVVQTEKCAACEKTVYAMEKLEMNGHIYHRNCFKCSHCSARLTAKTFSMNEGVIYCTNHFKQLFARKGNYDEGFGRQQYKKKWGENDKPATESS